MGAPVTQGGLYGLVAWPSPELDRWLTTQRRELGIQGYGAPHLNLRAPFPLPVPAGCCAADSARAQAEARLIAEVRQALCGLRPVQVQLSGWTFFPHVALLGCQRSAALEDLHRRALSLPGAPPQPYDQKDYLPHLTLALGLLDWAEPDLRARISALVPPTDQFEVRALSLLREVSGELREVHTFPLHPFPPGEPEKPSLPPASGAAEPGELHLSY